MITSPNRHKEESRMTNPKSPPQPTPPPPNTTVTSPEAGPTIPRSVLDNEAYFSALQNIRRRDDSEVDNDVEVNNNGGDDDDDDDRTPSPVKYAYTDPRHRSSTGEGGEGAAQSTSKPTVGTPIKSNPEEEDPFLPPLRPIANSHPTKANLPSTHPQNPSITSSKESFALLKSQEDLHLASLIYSPLFSSSTSDNGNMEEVHLGRVDPLFGSQNGEEGEEEWVKVEMSGVLDLQNGENEEACVFGERCAAKVLVGMAAEKKQQEVVIGGGGDGVWDGSEDGSEGEDEVGNGDGDGDEGKGEGEEWEGMDED